MRLADEELSRFKPESELSLANLRAGSSEQLAPGRRLRTLLTIAARAQRVTEGRFDPRVITVLEAIGEEGGLPLPPTRSGRGAAWLATATRRGHFRLLAPIDSGGLGKGLGLRWALRAARHAAPEPAGLMLEAGGDLAVDGVGPDGGPWSIGIEDPRQPGRLLAAVSVRGGAVATSSVSVRTWEHDGEVVHHLIDPAKGRPADTGLLAVTVHAPDPAWAEVMTKSLFIGGRRSIGREARRGGLAAWWVEEGGELHMTPAARAMTTWTLLDALTA